MIIVVILLLFAVASPSQAQDKQEFYAGRATALDVSLLLAVKSAQRFRQEMRLGYVGYHLTVGSDAKINRMDKLDEANGDYDKELKRYAKNQRIGDVAIQHFHNANENEFEERKYLRIARRVWNELRADPAFSDHYKLTYRYFPKSLVDKTNKDFHPDEIYGVTSR